MTVAAQRWLITGASGFLGTNLGAYLSDRCERIGLIRSRREPDTFFDRYFEADLRDGERLMDAVAECQPTVIVHAAALASHDQCEANPRLAWEVNVEATDVLAKAADASGARLIVISTDAVFDGTRGNYREDDEPSPFSVYGRTKLAGEQRALQRAAALIVRTNFFGWSPSGQRSILEFFVNSLQQGRQVRGFTDFTVSSMYVQHLTAVLWELGGGSGRTPPTGLVHVASADAHSKYAFGTRVAHEFELESALITATRADVDPPRNRDLSLNTNRVASWLGRTLPTQPEGINQAHRDAVGLRLRIREADRA